MSRYLATDMRGQQRAKKKATSSTMKYVLVVYTYDKRVIIMDCVATTFSYFSTSRLRSNYAMSPTHVMILFSLPLIKGLLLSL